MNLADSTRIYFHQPHPPGCLAEQMNIIMNEKDLQGPTPNRICISLPDRSIGVPTQTLEHFREKLLHLAGPVQWPMVVILLHYLAYITGMGLSGTVLSNNITIEATSYSQYFNYLATHIRYIYINFMHKGMWADVSEGYEVPHPELAPVWPCLGKGHFLWIRANVVDSHSHHCVVLAEQLNPTTPACFRQM